MPVGESPDAETTSRRSAAKSRRQDDHKPTNVNIELIVIGKTDSKEIESLLAMYARRINFYCRFAVTVLPDVKNTKNLAAKQQRTTEGASLLRQFGDGDYVVLLDERGDEYAFDRLRLLAAKTHGERHPAAGAWSSAAPTDSPTRYMHGPIPNCRSRSMTFSHQIVRAIFAEQIYRAFTILNNEPYHHE